MSHDIVDVVPVVAKPRGGGALPKNMWRVCAATLTPFSNRLSLNDPLFIFHILLSPNDPHFQNALSLNDPPFLEIFIGEIAVMLSLNDTHFHR